MLKKNSYGLLKESKTQSISQGKYNDEKQEICPKFLPYHQMTRRNKLSQKNLAKLFINTRCNENFIWATSTVVGVLALCMQITPIFLRNWVHIIEPRTVSRKNDKDDNLELPFIFNIGYFCACREWTNNLTEYASVVTPQVLQDFPQKCVWTSMLTNNDLSYFSFATNAIFARLTASTTLHFMGSTLTIFAFIFSIIGHMQKNNKTLYSAILYFFGGLMVMVGILQVICVVDDEMYPRMKPKGSGEPSLYNFSYGYSILAAALSFLPIQMCIYLQTSAFFSRFPDPQSKALIVPGLNELLQQVSIIRSRTHKLGKCSVIGSHSINNSDLYAQQTILHGITENLNTTNFNGHNIAGVSVNFANRQSRDLRAISKDYSILGLYQGMKKIGPPLTQPIIRRFSSQL